MATYDGNLIELLIDDKPVTINNDPWNNFVADDSLGGIERLRCNIIMCDHIEPTPIPQFRKQEPFYVQNQRKRRKGGRSKY